MFLSLRPGHDVGLIFQQIVSLVILTLELPYLHGWKNHEKSWYRARIMNCLLFMLTIKVSELIDFPQASFNDDWYRSSVDEMVT